ncbi:MAG: hypothetical protein AAGC88_02845 [Bacteroidota bacterium]
MGDFDKVLKENVEAVFLPLLEKLMGLSIVKSEEIKDKVQVTMEREPDFLKKVEDSQGEKFILHLEFQTTDDPEMVYRMAEYKAILQRKYKLTVRQLVIYLGSSRSGMPTTLPEDQQITGFQLANIQDFDTRSTLASEVPQEIIMSILTDYAVGDADDVIDKIIDRLQRTTKNETELRRAIQQLLVLSRLRNLETVTKKKVADMPITYDITKDGLYKEGMEQGIGQGIEQNKLAVVKRALIQRKLTVEEIADLAEVSINYVLAVKVKLDK